jgi:hypothetical protein
VRKIWIYTIVIAPFFAFKEQAERQLGLPLCLLAALIIALLARLIAERYGSDLTIDVDPLPIIDACALVVADIAKDTEHLTVRVATGEREVSEALGTATQDFFRRYDGVRSVDGRLVLDVAEIRLSKYVEGLWSIGHYEDWDVVQRPGSDEVFIVEGPEMAEDDMDICFVSIYHLVLNELD